MDCISGKCQCGALGRPCPDGYRCQSGTCVCLGSVAGVLGEACKLSLDIYYGGVKMDNRFVLMYSLGASGRVYVVDAKRKHRRTIGASKYFGINGLQSAWVSTNGTIYAVPANAPKTVVRYDGTSWTTVHTAKQFLVSIWGWGSRIFAVGAAGTIVEFDGSQWTEKSVGTDGFFFVAGSSQNDVWALGPATYHYNGVQWSADIAPVWSVSSVSSAADGGVLVFGKSQSDVQQIVVRTGDTWVPIPLPPQMIDVDRVAIGLGGVVYAAGSCTSSNCVLRYSSDKWTTVLSEEDFGNSTRFMVPIGPGELLINGLSGSHGDTLRLLQAPSGDSGDWSRTWISTSPFNFSNGLASDAIYGARSSGVDNKPPYLIGFFNGVSWLPIEVESVSCSDCGNPTAVWPAAVDDIWVGGFYDAMIRRKGGVWTNYPLPHASTVCYGIWGSSPTNVYAIGFGPIGYVFQFNGTTWKDVTPGTETSFDTIWGSGPDDVYVSGTSAVYHFSAGKWEVVQGLSGDNFGKSLWGSGPKDVWGVGADLWRFDGQSWKVMTLPLGATAQSVRGTSATDVFLNGTNGVYRWDGQQWGPQLPYNELIWVDDVQMFTVDGFHIFR
ncbi:MAG: hypothetical protein KC609_23170 [Myxococcales bacterium]|nr:hypothetical protein [Myxococcales bacterium]